MRLLGVKSEARLHELGRHARFFFGENPRLWASLVRAGSAEHSGISFL
jgi:hypothetical protein